MEAAWGAEEKGRTGGRPKPYEGAPSLPWESGVTSPDVNGISGERVLSNSGACSNPMMHLGPRGSRDQSTHGSGEGGNKEINLHASLVGAVHRRHLQDGSKNIKCGLCKQ